MQQLLTVELDELAAQYHTLFKIGKELLGESDVDRLLGMAMDRAIAISGAARGIIILFDSAARRWSCRICGSRISASVMPFSRILKSTMKCA